VSILLVEDSVIDTHQISSYLRQWRLEFKAVGDGLDAWRTLQQPDPPRLVLLDWMLIR
jgi:CheY-like chemotaxis protein